MVVQEYYKTRKDGVNLFVTYSDLNVCIRKVGTGEIYDSAIDPEDKLSERHYEETDIPIELPEEPAEDLPKDEIPEVVDNE